MPNVFLYNPFESDFIENLINRWVNTERERGWKKNLVRARYGTDEKPLADLEAGDTLYVIGHGDVQANKMCDRTSHEGLDPEILHPEELARRLKEDGLTDKKIKIKIYSCLAARGVLDSFATNAAMQIKLKIGSTGGLSCKFTIYGYNEIISVLIKNPLNNEYGKFVGELKEDVEGGIEVTEQRASSSRKVLVKPGFGF
ncbi:hypothetical protein [Corallococcus caeni]|uniref:Uncharacterized protein n=1 Tax=Corallococcus caeni TaxID=3082388 RepID=A0ABQ6QVY1_9BACT|nr:hypothetical protein ASNO1_44480 [Corallococcus sp. NO1]